MNVGKTEGMVFNHSTCKSKWEKERPVVYYNQVPLRLVEEFKYLGIMFHSTQKTYQTMIQYHNIVYNKPRKWLVYGCEHVNSGFSL